MATLIRSCSAVEDPLHTGTVLLSFKLRRQADGSLSITKASSIKWKNARKGLPSKHKSVKTVLYTA